MPDQQKGFSFNVLPSVYVFLRAPRGFTEVDMKTHCAVPASHGPAHMHCTSVTTGTHNSSHYILFGSLDEK